jgi:hypothetical protein
MMPPVYRHFRTSLAYDCDSLFTARLREIARLEQDIVARDGIGGRFGFGIPVEFVVFRKQEDCATTPDCSSLDFFKYR